MNKNLRPNLSDILKHKAALFFCFHAAATGEKMELEDAPHFLRLYWPAGTFSSEVDNESIEDFTGRLHNSFQGFSDPHDKSLGNLAGKAFSLGGYRPIGAGKEMDSNGEIRSYVDIVPDRLDGAASKETGLDNFADNPFFKQQAREQGVVEIKTSTGYRVDFGKLGR